MNGNPIARRKALEREKRERKLQEDIANWGYGGWTPNPVMAHPKLSGHAKMLYGLLNALKDKDGWAWAAEPRLAKQLGKTERTIRNLVRELVAMGFLKVETDGWQNFYAVLKGVGPATTGNPLPEVTGNPLPEVTGNNQHQHAEMNGGDSDREFPNYRKEPAELAEVGFRQDSMRPEIDPNGRVAGVNALSPQRESSQPEQLVRAVREALASREPKRALGLWLLCKGWKTFLKPLSGIELELIEGGRRVLVSGPRDAINAYRMANLQDHLAALGLSVERVVKSDGDVAA
jgi:hypothetical protein